jgi:hypothetical protein
MHACIQTCALSCVIAVVGVVRSVHSGAACAVSQASFLWSFAPTGTDDFDEFALVPSRVLHSQEKEREVSAQPSVGAMLKGEYSHSGETAWSWPSAARVSSVPATQHWGGVPEGAHALGRIEEQSDPTLVCAHG